MVIPAASILFCLVRIPPEQKMMLEHFGDDFVTLTGRTFPKLRP